MEPLWIVVIILIFFSPAIIYQLGAFLKEMRQQRLVEMEKRSEMDSKILGLDTSSTEIKVELAQLRKEVDDLKRVVAGTGQSEVRDQTPQIRSEQ